MKYVRLIMVFLMTVTLGIFLLAGGNPASAASKFTQADGEDLVDKISDAYRLNLAHYKSMKKAVEQYENTAKELIKLMGNVDKREKSLDKKAVRSKVYDWLGVMSGHCKTGYKIVGPKYNKWEIQSKKLRDEIKKARKLLKKAGI